MFLSGDHKQFLSNATREGVHSPTVHGHSPTLPGPLSKQDVADLLDTHYWKLTTHFETCIERLKLSQTTSIAGGAESLLSTRNQGMDTLRRSSLVPQPRFQDSLVDDDFDIPTDPKEERPCTPNAPLKISPPLLQQHRKSIDSSDGSTYVAKTNSVHSVKFSQNVGVIEADLESLAFDERTTVDTWGETELFKTGSDRTSMLKLAISEIKNVQGCSAFSVSWEGIAAVINIVNTVLVGVRIEYERRESDTNAAMHRALDTATLVLCAFFVCELLNRFRTQKLAFFTGSDCAWNGFEVLISMSTVVDEILRRTSTRFGFAFQWLSAVRIITLLKHHSVLQSMPFWFKLHALVSILQRCCIAVVWPVAIILLLTYLLALALTQRTTQFCFSEPLNNDLCKFFGGLEASIFSLLAAVLGGLPWGVLYDEFRNLGVFYTMIFVLFVVVTSLILLNTLLSAVMMIYQQLEGSRVEDDITMQMRRQREFIEKAMHFFDMADTDFNGNVSLQEFKLALKDKKMVALLDSMKVEVFDIETTFDLLDADCSGFIDVNELIEGLLRISGTARGVDLLKVAIQVDKMNKTLEKVWQEVGDADDISRSSIREPSRKFLEIRESKRGTDIWQQNFSSLRKQVINEIHRANPGSASRIREAHHRSMSLKELRAVGQTVELLCQEEKWVDCQTRAKLAPADVNLYHFNHYFILPATLPYGVVFKNVVGFEFWEGLAVIQVDENGLERANGEITEVLGQDSFRLYVSTGRFTDSDMLPIFIDGQSCQEFIIETPTHLSYKELVNSTPMDPVWFCSHWWGERIFDFVACIECHSRLRKYPEEATGYWICAYANDQHNLGIDIGGDVENSSFFKAMAISSGVLVILDPAATAFSRIWCDFEIYKAIQDEKELDVVTVRQRSGAKSHSPRACMLTQSRCPGETSRHKMQREMYFPLRILSRGMSVRLEDGDASQESDKDAILHIMAQGYCSTSTDFDATVKVAIEKANATLHAYFAQAAWPSAVKRQNVQDFDSKRENKTSLPDVLAQDASLKCLALDFSYIDVLSDQDLKFIAQGLPPNLEILDLDFSNCNRITDAGVIHLGLSLKYLSELRKIILNFSSCVGITDKGVLALSDCWPMSLRDLRLHFLACRKISPLSGQALASSITTSMVQSFSATFKGSLLDQDFESLKDLRSWIRKEKIPIRSNMTRSSTLMSFTTPAKTFATRMSRSSSI